MDLENLALMSLLSQAAHQLQHFVENTKSAKLAQLVQPIITAIKSAVAGIAAQ